MSEKRVGELGPQWRRSRGRRGWPKWRSGGLAGAVVLFALALAACGGGGGGAAPSSTSAPTTSAPTTSPAPSGNADAQIKQDYVRFFDGRTPADTKIALLQNGQQFAQVIRAQSQSPLAQQTTAQVGGVRVNGTQAAVTYTVLIAGKPALANQTGTAVLVNGSWKVGEQSFCSLLSLQGQAPPPCPPVPSTAPTTR